MGNDGPEIIDAEIVESDNLPAVIEQPESYQTNEPIKGQGRDWETYAEPSRRCAGHKKTGERCKNAAILGSTVCRFHGGAARHVKAAARARLENAADLMAKQLLGIALTAESEGVKLAAIKDSLDRAGLRPPAEVVLSQGETKRYEEVFEGIAGLSREESRARRGYADSPAAQPVEDRSYGSGEYDSASPPATVAEEYSLPEPPRQARPRRRDDDRHAEPPQRHISGDAAYEISGQLHRQLAIESPHKRYRRP